MDPTKSFDHLDPKLKDTYARVMGTTTPGPTDPAQIPSQPATDASQIAAPSPAFDPAQLATSPTQNPIADPLSPQFPPVSTPTAMGPNPGTGPTITTVPQDTTSLMTPPADPLTTNPAPDASAPPTNTFFSNPSPATTAPSQTPQAPDATLSAPTPMDTTPVASAPVTPYSAADFNAAQAASTEQLSQPLPSPAAVAQSGPHETSALLKVIYIVVAVVFFAAYTVFWIKIFNLPFLF